MRDEGKGKQGMGGGRVQWVVGQDDDDDDDEVVVVVVVKKRKR